MNPTLLFLLIGCFAGILSGLIGVGGGIVIVPALMLVAGFPQLMANGTSLAVLLLPVGFAAVAQYYRDGNVNVQAAATIAISFAVCAWLGAFIAKKMSPMYLRFSFGIILAVIGVYIAFGAWRKMG